MLETLEQRAAERAAAAAEAARLKERLAELTELAAETELETLARLEVEIRRAAEAAEAAEQDFYAANRALADGDAVLLKEVTDFVRRKFAERRARFVEVKEKARAAGDLWGRWNALHKEAHEAAVRHDERTGARDEDALSRRWRYQPHVGTFQPARRHEEAELEGVLERFVDRLGRCLGQ
jgi:hypothetical protein